MASPAWPYPAGSRAPARTDRPAPVGSPSCDGPGRDGPGAGRQSRLISAEPAYLGVVCNGGALFDSATIWAAHSAGRLIDAYSRHDWLMGAVEKRLREELADLQVEINEEKSRIVDLGRGESFGFLGFDFRRIRSRRGAWRADYTPKLKKRTALLRKLKEVFRRYQSQPVARVVQLINPMLRGWVNYFAVGHSSACFSFIKDWVEKKVRRHMLRARKRKGFGWTRWSRPWLYETLKLFNSYRVRRSGPKVAPAG
jgi:hypothetical protein